MVLQKITNKNYLITRFLHKNVQKSMNGRSDIRVLDVGCGIKPYRRYFENSQLYIGVDKNPNGADIVGVAEALPVRSTYFDIVLCTQVLEHVEQPHKALKEIKRVLRNNGLLILSTHGFWIEEHEFTDYWRWTFQGLTKLLNECGFKIIKHASMDPIVSLFQTILLFHPQKNMFLPLIAFLNTIAMLLQKVLKIRGPKLHIVHFVIAKPLK